MRLIDKKGVFIFVLFMNIIFACLIVSASYSETLGYTPSLNNLGGEGFFYGGNSLRIDDSMCQQGTDFIVQISPLSCEPTVVTSDLLEEENVNVFCKMTATKINPLVEVTGINQINFVKDYPKEVVNIGYMPAQSALGYANQMGLGGSLSLDNLGYVVITLRKQPNESALTNCEKTALGSEVCWVNGTLTAMFNYDVSNSFGVGNALFYLPVMDDKEWQESYVRYSFWGGRGYLRAEDVNADNAVLSVYSDNTVLRGILSGERRYDLQRYSSNINLKAGGEASNKIYLPGLSPCLTSLQLKLEGVEDPDTFARIKVNDDYLELRKGESFLDGKCFIVDLDSKGVSQEVEIKCREDDKAASPFSLRILPKVDLEVNGDVKSYEVGDYLYQSSDGKKFVYLGYVGVAGEEFVLNTADSKSRLYTYLVALPVHKSSLSYEEITSVARHAESIKSTSGKTGLLDKISEGFNKWVVTGTVTVVQYIVKGEDFKFVPYMDNTGGTAIAYEFKGGRVALEGFSGVENRDSLDLNQDLEHINHYNDAMSSFDTVINSYPQEVEDKKSLLYYGEMALIEEINLAYALGQKETMLELCKQFAEDYSDSIYSPEICVNYLKILNSKNAVKEVVVNGRASDISFEGISSPGINQYSARVVVTDSDGQSKTFDLRKDKIVSLSSEFRTPDEIGKLKVSEYIVLEDLETDSAKIKISVDNHGDKKEVLVDTKTLRKGVSSEKYGEYTFVLTEVTLKKVAKVSVIPSTEFAKSNSTFNFKIGVEKRAIQLSPEKAAEKIIQINKSIEDWEKVSKALGGVVSAGKAACTVTFGILTVKNLIANWNGGAIARQEVMSGEGGWNKICEQEMKENSRKYSSLNSCFLAHSEEIESDVNRLSSVINKQNQIVDGIASENSDEFLSKFSDSVENTINSLTASQTEGINDLNKLKEALNTKYLQDNGAYTFDELKEIQMYAMYLQSTPASANDEFRNTAIQRLNSVIADVNKNSEDSLELLRKIETNNLNINPNNVILINDDKRPETKQIYEGETLGGINLQISNLQPNNPVATAQIGGEVYILVLDGEIDSKYYPVKKTMQITAENTSSNVYWIYDVTGNYVRNEEVINKLKDYTFQVIEAISFKNEYKSSYGSSEILLRYSGTYAYRKYPVVVPFDRKEGWYAGIKYPETAYDASGVIREFWLCNVGEDGIEEFQLEDFGGDYCQLINTAQANDANAFSNSVNIKQKINEAIQAISRAQKGYKDGITKVFINTNVGTVKVGEPVTSTPVGQCTDYMSVEDCSLLFNVCDPVICPASRCDYGGKYPVTDVIQTGVVGSLFLCYPNAKWEGGDVYVPFCISGINAGLENWITVKKDYAACLQKSIDTGETVGICDEMHSIYLCEFFWKQAIPVVKLMGPRILEKVVGQSSRGGGEYQSIVEAFKNAQNSVTSFTQYYAENSYRAFKARSTEEIGTSICGSFASVVYPDGGTFLSNLIAPDSPFQFTGKFEESQLTTSTNPPTSHYKVYFHIYAGTDSGAYYSVKLRGSGSSYYQDTIVDRMVDSGYIPRGESVDEAMDFTAPSGYSTLCINVNGREECGFKEVSTSFAVNYLSDLYVKDQATDKDITTKDDCTSGSASIYSLLDLNAESAADNLLNSELYSQGIIRTCSTNSPGAGTDPLIGKEGERWKKVGYCDDKNIGCWIDTKSVEDAMKFLNLEEEALSEIDKNALTSIGNSYFSFEEFNSKKQEVKAETDSIKKIALINSILNTGKIFYNNQKAYLYLEKGKAYASLAMEAYTSYLKVKEEEDKLLNAPCDESILGKRILTIAQNKIGTDTTRLQAGSWVKDNVCATFVSNVLIEAGALPALGNDPLASATSDRDAIVELIPIMVSGGYTEIPRSDWQTGLKEGDVIVWGCQGSGCSDKPDADKYQHITIFSRYYVTGSSVITEIIHDPGTPGPVAAKNYTAPFGTTWYITYVYRAACADITEIPEGTIEPDIDENEVDGGYVSPAIEFEDGSSETNVCYKFFNSEWHWAIAETGRGTAFNPSCNDPDFPKGRKWFDTSTFIDEKDRQLDDVSVNFVESLEGKDYLGGIELLIKRTTNIKKEGIFNKELSSYYRDSGSYSGTGTYDPERLTVQRDVVTTMNHKGIFEVDIRNARISPIYYQFKGVNGWKWGVNDDTLLDVSTTVIPSGNYNGLTPTENVGLINSLNGNTNLYEGGAILLDPETAQLRSEYGSTSGANMDTSSLESNFQRRDLTKLTNLMKLLSTSVSSASFRCNCGTDCEDYAEWIVQYSGVSNIPDELLLLAIMSQESFCTSILSPDGNDVGLMQINLGNCGYYGLPTNKNTCKNNLLEDEELNIRVGAQHLRLKYSAYKDGLTFNCPPIIETYSGWEAALRGYNGWGCTGDDNYVENVKSKYFELLRLYGGNLPVAPAPSLSDSELATILVGFSSAEKKAITDAIICNDCGEGIANFCDPKECEAIGFKLFKECKYISLAFGLGKCEEVICTQGETKCVEDLYYTCVEEGTSWIAEHVKGKCGYT